MSQQKEMENQEMGKSQFEQALSDFKIEQEDEVEVRKAGFKQVRFKRPPRTSREAVETLQEADRRYASHQQALFGKGRTQINENSKKAKKNKEANLL